MQSINVFEFHSTEVQKNLPTGAVRKHGLTRLKMKINNFMQHHRRHLIVVTKLFPNPQTPSMQ